MAINIIAELEKPNELIAAIRSMAQVSIDQALDEETNEPNWAVVISLLARMAEREMEELHKRLTKALSHQGSEHHA